MTNNRLQNWLQLSKQDRTDIFTEVARIKNLHISSIEKDWWVVQTLSIIFSMEYWNVLVFKGGTSLSKGWNLIHRFSEDIDLALDRTFLGFSGELTKGDIRRLRRKSFQFITDVFTDELRREFFTLGFENVTVNYREVENHDQDPLIIEINYPALTEKGSYLNPAILVEIGSRSLKEPFTQRTFGSIVSEVFVDRLFADNPITIPVVNPERTFLEKIFLLHEEFQKPQEKIRVERLSRHLYDIEKLSQTEFLDRALQDMELYHTIVKHREKFTPISGIDYANHTPDKINFIPPDTIIKKWEDDYNEMKSSMIYGQTLSFDELISRLTKLQKRINQL